MQGPEAGDFGLGGGAAVEAAALPSDGMDYVVSHARALKLQACMCKKFSAVGNLWVNFTIEYFCFIQGKYLKPFFVHCLHGTIGMALLLC